MNPSMAAEIDFEFEPSPASAHDYAQHQAKMQYINDPRFAAGIHVPLPGYPSVSSGGDLMPGGSFPTIPGSSPTHPDALSDNTSPLMSKGNTSHVSEIIDMTRDFEQPFDADGGLAQAQAQATVAAAHPSVSANRPLVSTEVFVKVAYRSSPIAGMRVTHPQGCRIFYGTPPPPGMPIQMQECLFGPRALMQLSLPHPNEAQALLPAMWEVLEAMHRGIIIEMHNNDIHVTRLCRAAVYWGPPGHDGIISKLERFKRTRVFSYQSFLQTYESYRMSERTNIACYPPSYEVVLGIAQPWGQDRLRDNNLLTITLIHSLGEKLIESLHRLRWSQNKPFDSDYLDIDSKTSDDELASNATKHMIKAGRATPATHVNSDGINGRSMQHPALAAMNKQPSRQQAKTSKAQQRVQQLHEQQVAAAMLQVNAAQAASGHAADIQLQ